MYSLLILIVHSLPHILPVPRAFTQAKVEQARAALAADLRRARRAQVEVMDAAIQSTRLSPTELMLLTPQERAALHAMRASAASVSATGESVPAEMAAEASAREGTGVFI